jgi:hypothetical protein
MKPLLFLTFSFVLFMTAPDALALTQDWGGLEDDWSGPVSYTDPIAVRCYALSGRNQRCRDCATQYDDNGQPTSRIVCAYVARKASCGCNSSPCKAYGSCDYI